MYHVAEIIENDRTLSHVAEISFHPTGSYFAATYEHLNEVRLFDSQTRKLLHVLKNPESEFETPHGLLFTDKYLLVSNSHNFTKPGTINVYRNESAIKKPIQKFQTPFNHLREPHSLAIRNGRLVVTYAENIAPSGAIVSYGFNEETGEITGLLDKTESWFSGCGDPKGICFNSDGTKVFVTFESDKQFSIIEKIFRSLASDDGLSVPARFIKLSNKATRKLRNTIWQSGRDLNNSLREFRSEASFDLEEPNLQHVTQTKNGIATFSINADGKIARRPEQVVMRKNVCRLENIDLFDGKCVVTDTVNHFLFLYDLDKDPNLVHPFHSVNFGNATPHGAKFSPDGALLVISSLGRTVVNQRLRFIDWESPREDKIFVLEREAEAAETAARGVQ